MAAPNEAPSIVGRIARVDGDPASRILINSVELQPPNVSAPDSVLLLLKANVAIELVTAEGRTTLGTLHDLIVGRRIQAWRGGTEYRTLPPQYDVVRILVLGS